MKQILTRRHQTGVHGDWNPTLKMQLAAILEASLGPTFGPENDDEPGCHTHPIYSDKDNGAPKAQTRPFFPSEDEEEDEDEDGYMSCVIPLAGPKSGGDGGWDAPITCLYRIFTFCPPDDGGAGGFDGPHCGDEGGGDTGWSPVKFQARPSFDPEGDDDDEDECFTVRHITCGPEGNDGGWDAPMKCRAFTSRPSWPDEKDIEEDYAPTRRHLRIKFGDEDCRGGGWSKLALFQPHLQQPEEEPGNDFFLGGDFRQSHARSPRVAVLAAPHFGKDDDED